jgi:hypothetical protein
MNQTDTFQNGEAEMTFPVRFFRSLWAYIQRRGLILAWIVILSVYGADTIEEVKLLISPFLRWSLDLWNQLLGFQTILIYMQYFLHN